MTKPFPPIGMGPEVWGPIFWTTMHIVSMGYPEKPSNEEQTAAANFYNSLATVIPCPICREHYAFILKDMPVETTSRTALINWCFTIHNKVNEKLGKSAISWEQFIETAKRLRDTGSIHSTNSYEPILFLAVGALLGVGGFYAYKRYIQG